jgi:hypothetical protein
MILPDAVRPGRLLLDVGRGQGYVVLSPLLRVNQLLIRLSKGLFSYQIFVRAEAKPTVQNLLGETIDSSNLLRQSVLDLVPSASSLQDPQGMEQAARDQLVESALDKENVVLSQIEDAQ